ncbi:MAG: DUF1080 domain-containing protein, partial [Moraxellaceae bacterium]
MKDIFRTATHKFNAHHLSSSIAKFLLLALIANPLHADDGSWKSLFNGKDLTGWETFVSTQPPSNTYGIKLDSTRGVNSDPLKVFSVVDGTLRISGEEWGGLTTIEEFENFELSFDARWGEKKWPPREQALRDSGVLYYAVGEHGAQSGHWMRSHEFQVQEGDCGDYHSLDGVLVDAKVTDANEGDWKFYRYDPKAALRENIHTRILKLGNYEKPGSEWNTFTVIANGKTIIHKVNGREVLR